MKTLLALYPSTFFPTITQPNPNWLCEKGKTQFEPDTFPDVSSMNCQRARGKDITSQHSLLCNSLSKRHPLVLPGFQFSIHPITQGTALTRY